MSSTADSENNRRLKIQHHVNLTLPEDQTAIVVYSSDLDRLIESARKNAGGSNIFHTIGSALLGAALGVGAGVLATPPQNVLIGGLITAALGVCGLMAVMFAHLLKVNMVEEIAKLKKAGQAKEQ